MPELEVQLSDVHRVRANSTADGLVLDVGRPRREGRFGKGRVPRRASVGERAGVWLFVLGAAAILAVSGYNEADADIEEPQGRISSRISPGGVTVRHASSMQSRSPLAQVEDDAGQYSACDPDDPMQVLFIGNSYTFYHGMPKMVAEIGGSAGCQLEVTWATSGGYLLELHAQDPVTLEAIHQRHWDVVVLQNQSQQPGYKPEDVRKHTLPAVEKLAAEIYANNPDTKLLYYTTWGRRDGDRTNCDYNAQVCTFEGHTEAIETGYGLYAAETKGELARVGHAFSMIARDSGAPVTVHELYDPDGTHPSLRGSYLAAAVFFYELTGISPEGLAFPNYLTEHEAAYLQQIAAYTVEGKDIEEPFATVQTKEGLSVRCDAETCPKSEGFDRTPSRAVLFEGNCSDYYLRTSVTEAASTSFELACSERGCASGALHIWARPGGEALHRGEYSVYVLLDVDRSGGPSEGDVEACENSYFRVGSGKSRAVTSFFEYSDTM